MTNDTDLAQTVAQLRDGIVDDLLDLVKIPSVYKSTDLTHVQAAATKCEALLNGAGVTDVKQLPIGDPKTHAPLVYARCGPEHPTAATPTVLLYAHYDVVESGDWGDDDAFKNAHVDQKTNRLVGRGAADDKSGVMMHIGALRAFKGKPPVNLIIVLEGEEESGDTLEGYVRDHPDLFRADVIVVADSGNHKLGEPTFTTSLRGVVSVDVSVDTLKSAVHSGSFGGPAPDAFMALIRLLAPLLDDKGDVAVHDLVKEHWTGYDPGEADFRTDAGVLDDAPLIGSDSIGSRLYTRPSVNVVGLTGPQPWKKPVNQLTPSATARISMRIAPLEDPKTAFTHLREFLLQPALNPWGLDIKVSTTPVSTGAGFKADTGNPTYDVAKKAMNKAYPGKDVVFAGQGGSIPLVTQLQQLNPGSAILVIGCEEPLCRIHSYPESVDLDELMAMTLAESELLRLLGA
jgi:acetylornithine deacetylase/succinyl-diaminopimelate desuccinylase-like protein